MKQVNINLENCYGITKLKKDFDFLNGNVYAIYSPNGTMKTSFANTFKDISKVLLTTDRVFRRPNVRDIKKENNVDLSPEEIFVIEPYNEYFVSSRISTLLVNKRLKNDYENIYIKIDEAKEKLFKKISKMSGLKSSLEEEISISFTGEEGNFFDVLETIKPYVADLSEPVYSQVSYKEIFNEKVLNFLNMENVKENISSYITKYNELIESSTYFKKGVFNHNNASAVSKNLKDNGFFEAEHFISLHGQSEDQRVNNKEEFDRIIEQEKNIILNNTELLASFENIDKILTKNEELRSFREFLTNNTGIILELLEIEELKKKIWLSYFKTHKDLYINLITEYEEAKENLKNIIAQAKLEITRWRKVVDIFNKRFFVPFKLEIANQEDVILKQVAPFISFVFKDFISETPIEQAELVTILSTGEKHALYILNVIFEFEGRIETGQETLFIVDDIADSFDYKNKYAIIEYLKEISNINIFNQIILTHNFDFFRTIQSRLNLSRDTKVLMVEKTLSGVNLVKAEYFNPFNYWMDHLNEDKKFIASIAFSRNIINYIVGEDDQDYLKLTSLLHIKSDTDSITKIDVESIYKKFFPKQSNLNLLKPNDKIIDLIFSLAEVCLLDPEGINLENKIILSIAIRLKAEKFMLSKLTDKNYANKNQTREFFDRYNVEFGNTELEKVKILERVNLITPENIHLNSFMYEPILDISDVHLKELYNDVKVMQ